MCYIYALNIDLVRTLISNDIRVRIVPGFGIDHAAKYFAVDTSFDLPRIPQNVAHIFSAFKTKKKKKKKLDRDSFRKSESSQRNKDPEL